MNRVARLFAAAALAAVLPASVFAASAERLSDAEIAEALGAANQGELDAAALAASRTKDAAVDGFAARMLKDHGAAKKELTDIVSKAGLQPAESPLSERLKKDGAAEAAALTPLSGAAFDRAYMDAQVSDHAGLLKKLDEEFIPEAKNPRLAAFLRKVRRIVSHHLAMARHVKAGLARAAK